MRAERQIQRESDLFYLLYECDACLYFKPTADNECTLVLMKSLVFRERNQESAVAAAAA